MQIIDITPGVKLYQDDQTGVLFGCPPEIIKHLMMQEHAFPQYILIPDKLYHRGVLQNCTEFPLYYFLFVLGNYFKGQQLNIIGSPEHIQNNRELLRLTLLGPTEEEYAQIGDSPYFADLYRESRALALKKADGSEAQIDDLVNFIEFQNEQVQTEHFTIQHEDYNKYVINDHPVDITFHEDQIPPYMLNADFVPMVPAKLGVDVLGGGSGFTPDKPCSGLLLNYNSDYMLLDCVPYLEYSLNARGISKQQVKSIFLTHIHDDHCNMFPLMQFNNKINFLGTKEIFWMALKKLSLMSHHDIEEFYSYFNFFELQPYQDNEFYGLSIYPHYSVHSIPTIGATFKMRYDGKESRIAFVGDNKSLPDIQNMVEDGVVTKHKYEYLDHMYHEPYDLIFPDGGMGILHGDPKDSLESRADRVVFMHLEKLPKEFDATFSIASPGKRYVIKESKDYAYMVKTMEFFYQNFPGMSEAWVTTLMNNMNIVRYNAGDVIMKQGEKSKGLMYIILSGNASVMIHDGTALRELAQKETGDFIGEMAIVRRMDERSASVVAKIPVTLCEMSEHLFYDFLKSEKRIDAIQYMWMIRSDMEKLYPFSGFSDIANDKIARIAQRMEIPAGKVILEEGTRSSEFYILLKGACDVRQKGKNINRLTAGSMFGEYGSLWERVRNATVITTEDSVVLEIKKNDLHRILDETPALNFYVNQLMKEREDRLYHPETDS
jgi:CRP/FNR family transcriptional regulator, cyclic AMP receptor protein